MAAKNITAFSFTSPAATGAISGTDISVTVPTGTDVTALVATFTHTGASVAVEGVAQTTAVTANDFTDPVVYTVTASDATTNEYTVTVSVSYVSVAMIAQLRRMTAEPTTTTYSDALLISMIEAYPHIDEWGEGPTDDDGVWNDDWFPTYDLNATAADVWQDKAGAVAVKFDFAADGGNYSQSQQYEQYMKQCRYYRSRRLPSTVRMVQSPTEYSETTSDDYWIANLPESD